MSSFVAAKGVDGRDKPGHDVDCVFNAGDFDLGFIGGRVTSEDISCE
jgi:hypothetical protein